MYAHQRENWFPRLHAAAVLAGTYTAFALLAFVEPKSFAGVPSQVLIPASILLPFFASFIAFVVFAPVSFGLYWLMERFDRRNLCHHCMVGVMCVALTFALILLAGFTASLIGNSPEQIEETGLLGPAMASQDYLLLAACAISGAAGGAAFYFARKVGAPGSSVAQTGGGQS